MGDNEDPFSFLESFFGREFVLNRLDMDIEDFYREIEELTDPGYQEYDPNMIVAFDLSKKRYRKW